MIDSEKRSAKYMKNVLKSAQNFVKWANVELEKVENDLRTFCLFLKIKRKIK